MMVAMSRDPDSADYDDTDRGDGRKKDGEDFDASRFLVRRGVREEEIEAAAARGTLPLLVLDALMFPERPRYDEASLVGMAGVDRDFARALWRAMGFPVVAEGEVAFYEDDLRALRSAAGEGISEGFAAEEMLGAAIVHQTRVMSAAMARIAEQSTDDLANIVSGLRAQGVSDDEIGRLMATSFQLDRFEELLWYLFRRQWRAAAWRRLARPAQASSPVAVGFVDLVRFAAVTEEVADEELERLILRFEAVAHDAIAEGGGRVVKMIGDAVMFVADDPERATLIAMDLVDAYAHDPLLPPARAGLSVGPVLARDGDYYGPTVNLAARIVDIARPSRVVVSDELHHALANSGHLAFRRLPPKRLKGIGRSTLWAAQERKAILGRKRHQARSRLRSQHFERPPAPR
jgi:adenylate cyclase